MFSKILKPSSEKVLTASLCGGDMVYTSSHVFPPYVLCYKLYALSAPGFAFEELIFFPFSISLYLSLSRAYFEIQSEEFDLLNSALARFFSTFPSLG